MNLINVKGLNDKRIKQLNNLGVYSTEDLAKFYPKNYLDLTKTTSINEVTHLDTILTCAKIESSPQLFTKGRLKYVKVFCSQYENTFTIIWFNQPYVITRLKRDKTYLFYGRVTNKFGQVTMTNPVFEELEKNYKLKGIVPVYKIKGNLTQSVVKNACLSSIKLSDINSNIPSNLINKYALSSLNSAYYEVHNPTNNKKLQIACDRIAVEEYFNLISAFKIIKGDKKQARINNYSCTTTEIKEFISKFPFEFTDGQKKAFNEIYQDLKGANVMNRLLQGDVGSGKTAVCVCALFVAFRSGYKSAVLSPTEVLAKQNYKVISSYLGEENVLYLSGSLTPKQKKEVKEKLKEDRPLVVVGTHALIEEDVVINNLSLFVCDEQQRFGVAQRSAILNKGKACDVLVMSATPIPRTLSLIFYGDLDISTIQDKPKSRAEIKTSIVPSVKYSDMLEFIKKEVLKGYNAYFVCPKIDGDGESTIMSVSELYEEIKESFSGISVGLLHGKMKDAEKTAIMEDFKNNKIKILVSTTVIEVGVDVPQANVMVIHNAERFGLSQLHQLRGRVGRSNVLSYCFLLCGNETDKAKERLNTIKNSNDGFKISEIDYDIRGGGDFLGERQSGKFITELGSLKYSSSSIFLAKKLSDEAFEDGDNIKSLAQVAKQKYEKLKDITMN